MHVFATASLSYHAERYGITFEVSSLPASAVGPAVHERAHNSEVIAHATSCTTPPASLILRSASLLK